MIFNFGGQGLSVWTWLTSFGPAVLLFFASMITLWMTIKTTNQRAQDDRDAANLRANEDRNASRERDRLTWRRDTLLRLATETMSAAITAHQQYRRALDLPEHAEAGAGWLDRITDAGKVITSASTTLQIIGATEAASECMHLRNAVMDDELLQLVSENARRLKHHRERFDQLTNYIDTRATVFAAIVTKEIGEPQPKLPVIPGR